MPNAPVMEGYRGERLIGRGGSAEVWLVHDDSGQAFAAKIFHESTSAAGRAEWKALNRHAGEHIVPAFDLVTTQDGRPALILPYFSRGSLYDVVRGRGQLLAGEIVTALGPIAGALTRLHTAGAIHGDITPSNILFDDVGKPFLSDLGATRVPAQPGAAEWGSDGFVAPEVLDGYPPTSAADVYGFGASIWFALTGEPPQPAALRPRLIDAVPGVNETLAHTVSACLSLTPSARPDAADVHRRVLGCARPVAVPLDRYDIDPDETIAGTNALSMTRRLRQAAQQSEGFTASEAVSRAERRRRAARTPAVASDANRKTRWGHSTVLTVGALAGVVGLAIFVPLPGSSDERSVSSAAASLPSPPSSQPAPEATTSSAKATPQAAKSSVQRSTHRSVPLTAAEKPTQADVQTLLNCRADAWNTTSQTRLKDCLAADSQALHDDTTQLAQAQSQHISYRAVGFTVTQIRSVTTAQGSVQVQAEVRSDEFTIHQDGKQRTQPSETTTVRLVLTPDPGRWRIKSWSEV